MKQWSVPAKLSFDTIVTVEADDRGHLMLGQGVRERTRPIGVRVGDEEQERVGSGQPGRPSHAQH